MLRASRLKKGDTIGVIVPSWPCNTEKMKEVQALIEYLQNLEIHIKLAPNFLKTDKFQTSWGTDEERANDFNAMVLDPNIQAIWCLQWGDTINQILDLIDYQTLKKHPKIIIGKSDIDVLHNAIYKKIWLITFHGPDSKIGCTWEMELSYTQEYFEKRLFQSDNLITASNNNDRYTLNAWKACGILIWCNLVSILKLAWTEYFPNFSNDFIFFIETYKDNPKGLTTKLTQLKMLWVFENCKWVVIGSNYGFDESHWKAEAVIQDFISIYSIPIIKTNEFGHYQPHAFLPIWAEVSINTDDLEIKIISDFLA